MLLLRNTKVGHLEDPVITPGPIPIKGLFGSLACQTCEG
jgi:hypothetical protein